MKPDSFSVRIYLQDGHVDGVKVVAMSKWPGRALVVPRASLPAEIDRKELNAPGVYILIGEDPQGRGAIHIGAADPVSADLARHAAGKTFWTWSIVCAAKDDSLKQAHLNYIEARLIQLAEEAGQVALDSDEVPEVPRLGEDDLVYAESFLALMLKLFPVLGLRAFEKPVTGA